MINQRSINSYRQAAAHSVSPGKLVLMLYDGALRFLNAAVRGFDESNFIRRNEEIHNNLIRTQAIITELQATLNLDAGGEFGQTMYRLYDYMREQLQLANRNKDPEPIRIVQQLLGDIRDAWSEMLNQASPVASSSNLAITC